MYTPIGESSVFFYSEDIELMHAVVGVLSDVERDFCIQIYGDDTISLLKRKYGFFCELFASLRPDVMCGMFELLQDFPCDTFNLNVYRDYLLTMNRADFIQAFLALREGEHIKAALCDDEGLDNFYAAYPQCFNSFLGCQSFFRQTDRFIRDYFAFAQELNTESFKHAIQTSALSNVQNAFKEAERKLSELAPLEYSQEIMGKVFKNRGPYEKFIFSPSLMLPYSAIRFFGKHQILFYTLRPTVPDDNKLTEQLSAIADGTRFKIISLLKDKTPIRGTDIARKLSLAHSTVSHHMEQLRNAGLINEEQVKNSKYFSLNSNNVGALIKRLTDILT